MRCARRKAARPPAPGAVDQLLGSKLAKETSCPSNRLALRVMVSIVTPSSMATS